MTRSISVFDVKGELVPTVFGRGMEIFELACACLM